VREHNLIPQEGPSSSAHLFDGTERATRQDPRAAALGAVRHQQA